MSDAHEHAHPHPNYMAVFWILLALTIAEVAVVYLGLSLGLLIAILLVMALVKAALVGLYFMHLKFDHMILTVIATVPFILLAIAVGVLSYENTHALPPLPMR